jgi:hypothetical protein
LHGAARSRNCMRNIFICNIYEHDHDRMVLHATVQNPGSNMHQNVHQVTCIPAGRRGASQPPPCPAHLHGETCLRASAPEASRWAFCPPPCTSRCRPLENLV